MAELGTSILNLDRGYYIVCLRLFSFWELTLSERLWMQRTAEREICMNDFSMRGNYRKKKIYIES